MRTVLYRTFQCVYWISTVLIAVYGAAIKADVKSLGDKIGPFLPLIVWLKDHAWFVFPLSIIAAISAIVQKRIGAPWVKNAVKHILDEMREHAFRGVSGAANYHHRVTLFRHVKGFCWKAFLRGRWPFGGWLVPFVRSGHLTQKISVCFYAPDNGDQAEGVVGQTFAQDLALVIDNLPDVSRTSVKEGELQEYAKKTFVDADWLRDEKSTARALIGIPVKVNGIQWGALVVDSRGTTIPNSEAVVHAYTLIAKVLGEILLRS